MKNLSILLQNYENFKKIVEVDLNKNFNFQNTKFSKNLLNSEKF